ncbi:MAG: hypothetical protein ACREDF_09605 [Thermoplasmata archaeon]
MVVPNPIENPSGIGANPLQVLMFSMTHVSGTFSTGPLPFTPKFAIYTGVIRKTTVGIIQSAHSVGVIIGTGGSARGSSVTLRGSVGSDISGSDVSGDDDAAAGYTNAPGTDSSFNPSFGTSDLDVTAFGAAGIDLTWSAAVDEHSGKLLVVGGSAAGGGGGNLFYRNTAIVDPDNGNDATGAFGDLTLPFQTIQAALDAIPTPAIGDGAASRNVWTIIVAPNDYDENLSVDVTRKRIILTSWGPWGLGTFNGADWAPSGVRRNITLSTTDATINDGIRNGFSIQPMFPAGEGLTTHQAYLTRPRISGKIDVSAVTGPSLELTLSCEVFGTDGASTGDSLVGGAAIVQSYLYHSRMRGKVTGSNWNFQVSERTRFGGLVDVNGYSTIISSKFDLGMTVATATLGGVQPDGFVNTDFLGTFTGPALSFRLDAFTDRAHLASGGLLAGGATKVFLDRPARSIRSTAASGALLLTDDIVKVDASGGVRVMTLPDPNLYRGHTITVKKSDTSVNTVTVSPFAAETIDGAASVVIATPQEAVDFYSDGTNWTVT